MLLSPLLLPAGKPLVQTLPPPQPAQLQINADQPGVRQPDAVRPDDGGDQPFLRRRPLRRIDPEPGVSRTTPQPPSTGRSCRTAAGQARWRWTPPSRSARPEHQPQTDRHGASGAAQRVGVANDGYWGIPVKPKTHYRASFYARSADDFHGPLTVSIESRDGATVYARAQCRRSWRIGSQYPSRLTPASVAPPRTPASSSRRTAPARSGSAWSRCSRRPTTIGPTATALT